MITPSAKIGIIDSLRNYSTDGLILNVDFNNDYGWSGNTANDLANTAIRYATPSSFVAVVSGSTARPGYIDLDGSTDYLIAGATVAGFAGLTSCTFDVWFRSDTFSTLNSTLISNTTSNAGTPGFGLLISTSQYNPRFAVTTPSTVITTLDLSGLTLADQQWANLYFRIEHSSSGCTATGKLFKPNGLSAANYTGVYINTSGITVYGNTANAINIGRRTASQQFANGQISSVRVYNRLLTTDEIEFNYASTKTRYPGHT